MAAAVIVPGALAQQPAPPAFSALSQLRSITAGAGAGTDNQNSDAMLMTGGPFNQNVNAGASGENGATASSSASQDSNVEMFSLDGMGSVNASASGHPETSASSGSSSVVAFAFTVPQDTAFYLRLRIDASSNGAVPFASQAFVSLQSLSPVPDPIAVNINENVDESTGFMPIETAHVGLLKAGVTYQLQAVASANAGSSGTFAQSSAEFEFEFHIEDTDADGLLDIWETEGGIDVTGDMMTDIPLDGANKDVKDIYIEYENASGLTVPLAPLTAVQSVFANAPAGAINLHFVAGQDDPSSPPVWADEWGEFKTIKDDAIGFETERMSDDADKYSKARRLSHHFCVFATTSPGNWSGRAEIPGNDFIVYLETVNNGLTGQTIINDAIAGTFMHELGHNLGLRHGGADDVLFKPNYMSVMNYTLQVPWDGDPSIWRLDYSRLSNVLDEKNLNESAGIGATDPLFGSWHTYFNITEFVMGDANTPVLVDASSQGAIDWNDDGGTLSTGLQIDLNHLVDNSVGNSSPLAVFKAEGSFGEVLAGFCDWCNLYLRLAGSETHYPGAHGGSARAETTEPPFESLVALTQFVNGAFFPCPADFNGDNTVDGMDLAFILASWGTANEAEDLNGDGTVDGMDLAGLLAQWGACP